MKTGILTKCLCFTEIYWFLKQFYAKTAIKEMVQLCDLSDPSEEHGSGPHTQASALTPVL